MPYSSVDPASLSGDALSAWYRRSPDEIEQARQAAAAQRYNDFFGSGGTNSSLGQSLDAEQPSVSYLPLESALDPDSSSQAGSEYSGYSVNDPASLHAVLSDDGSPGFSSLGVGPPLGPTGLDRFLSPGAAAAPTAPTAPRSPAPPVAPSVGGGRPLLPPGTPPLPSFFSSLFGGPVPLHGPNGEVTGYYDHDAAKVGLNITGAYAAVAPLLQPGGWMEAFPAEGGTVVTNAIREGIEEPIHMHHPLAKFLGGPNDQEREALRKSLHILFHQNLASELKEAGFLNVGGKGGSTADWAQHFAKNPGSFDQAIEILRRVSQDFDNTHGTSILPKLDRELVKFRGQ